MYWNTKHSAACLKKQCVDYLNNGMFSSVLLISNNMISLMQFGINKHLFKDDKLLAFEKYNWLSLFIPNCM